MRNKIIFIVISVLTVLVPIGLLLRTISAKVGFPIMFTLLGCQQLFMGLFIYPQERKHIRWLSIIFGSLFIIFGVFIVFLT